MPKIWIVATAGFALAIVSVTQAADKAAKPGNAAVAKIYQAKCASCHGAKGQGNEKMAKMFKCSPDALVLAGKKNLPALVKITTEGKNKMPAFKGKLTAAEIQAVCEYSANLK